jgi:MFS family permease
VFEPRRAHRPAADKSRARCRSDPRHWPLVTTGGLGRDFRLLWTGQLVSTAGSWISSVALPLLVLDLTGAATDAGVVRFAATLPLLVFTLAAGPIADRYDRRRVLLWCEVARLVAIGTLVVGLGAGAVSLPLVVFVALVVGTGNTFFAVTERASIRQLVPEAGLTDALAQNEVRANVGLIVGQALGGVLYGLGRLLPFLVDVATYLVSLLTIALIRSPLQEDRARSAARPLADVAEGLAYVWREPFLRVTALLTTGNNLVVNALYLAVIVLARQRGASSAEIGLILAFIGVGGVVGGLLATRLARRVSVRQAVGLALGVKTLLILALLAVPGSLGLGFVYGAMFLFDSTFGAALGSRQLRLVPDRLQGRVSATIFLLAVGAVPLASLAVGVLLDTAGPSATVGLLGVVMLATTVAGLTSRTVAGAATTAKEV